MYLLEAKTICACQTGGSRGAQLWAIDKEGLLRSTYQETPGGSWSGWSGEWTSGSPRNGIALTAAQQNDGRVALWVLTADNTLYCNYQTSAGGSWAGWSSGDWNGAPKLTQICACQTGGSRGAQLWAIDKEGLLRSTYQETPGGSWSGWSGEWTSGSPRNGIALTAAQQNDGRVALWVLTADNTLYCNYQTSAGGSWAGWSSGDWNGAPKLTQICACQTGGSRGAQLWGFDKQGLLRSTYQETPGGSWSRWSGEWTSGSPRNGIALTAAQQNDGRVALWVLTNRQHALLQLPNRKRGKGSVLFSCILGGGE